MFLTVEIKMDKNIWLHINTLFLELTGLCSKNRYPKKFSIVWFEQKGKYTWYINNLYASFSSVSDRGEFLFWLVVSKNQCPAYNLWVWKMEDFPTD